MKYDFGTLVDRGEIGNMKSSLATDELAQKGMIPFAGAEMDFKTAPIIVKALTDFSARGIYGYTLPDTQYIQAIQWWMKNARGFDVAEDEIIPTHGTIYSVGTAIKAFTQEGDGVIVMPPVYYRYEPRIVSNNRIVVNTPLKEKGTFYSIDFKLLDEKMSQPQNKLLVLCNPHNPMGKIFCKEDLLKIKDLSHKHDVFVFSDEIFGEISFGEHKAIPYTEVDPENGIICTSLGKVFNFTGVNHANVIIKNKKIREAFDKQRIADHFGSIDPFFYSALIAGYSPEGLRWVNEMKSYIWDNYILVKNYFQKHFANLDISPLEGGFTIWMDFRALELCDEDLKLFLEREALMFIDQGSEYGQLGSGFCRMNIASPRIYIEKCLNSLKKAYDGRGYGEISKSFKESGEHDI